MAKKQKAPMQGKVLLVLGAAEGPITRRDFTAHRIMSDMTSGAITQAITTLIKKGEVTHNKRTGMYSLTNAPAVTKIVQDPPKAKIETFIIIQPATRSVLLDIGGMRFPVIVE